MNSANIYFFFFPGGADDAHGNNTELEAQLNGANATWEITRYSDIRHGFSEWGGSAYDPRADSRSWWSMLSLFDMILEPEMEVGGGMDSMDGDDMFMTPDCFNQTCSSKKDCCEEAKHCPLEVNSNSKAAKTGFCSTCADFGQTCKKTKECCQEVAELTCQSVDSEKKGKKVKACLTCGAKKKSCSSGSECCSGNCKIKKKSGKGKCK
jgi:hypothetical protein